MLTVDVSPVGEGTIKLVDLSNGETRNPDSYPESFDCFDYGDLVSIESTPGPGYQFDHWTVSPWIDGFTTTKNQATFVNKDAHEITVYFVKSAPPPPSVYGVENVNANGAKQMIDNNKDLIVIDVSETSDYDAGHIICSFNYPWSSGVLTNNYTDFTAYSDYDILIYDQKGINSDEAGKLLSENGFSGIHNLTGGLDSWEQNGWQVIDSDCNCEECSLPPMAHAGHDQAVSENQRVTLNGSESDGQNGASLSYLWTQQKGTTISLSNPASVKPSFTAPYVQQGGESLIFHLTVTDTQQKRDTDSVTVNITWFNDPPSADAGPDQIVEAGDHVTLDASGSSDPEGMVLSYDWQIDSSTDTVKFSDNNAVKPGFTAPGNGGWVKFQLTVTDDNGKTDTDSVTITIGAETTTPPDAAAGPDQTVNDGDAVTLDGSGSSDPDGTITKYLWAQIEGPDVKLSDSSAVNPTFTAPAIDKDSIFVFQLTVEDNDGLNDIDTVTINVINSTDCLWNAITEKWDCDENSKAQSETETVLPTASDQGDTNSGGGGGCFISSITDTSQ